MNTTEREQLSQFLEQLTRVQAGPKDAEAQGMINRAMGQQPDAAYLLVQRALLQDVALKLAQDQITELQAELNRLRQASGSPSQAGGGFLDANAWGRNPVRPGPPTAGPGPAAGFSAPPPAAQAPGYYPSAPAQAATAAPASGFQAPSFLTSMATTAAGVAAGAFLFQGLGHLMGGGSHGAMNGLSGMGGLGGNAGNAANAGNDGASTFGLSSPQALADGGNAPHAGAIDNHFDSSRDAGASQSDATGGDRLLDTAASDDNFDSAGLDFDDGSGLGGSDDWA
ncbi:MAG: hypothetical protein JWQ88_113 [Rhodoferax sp.]|nr:hypothetical protein [Rhodoferax sp.]